jgi:hypothetical protein
MTDHRDSPLSSEHVTRVFEDCLAHGAESHPTITVQGIVHTAHFAVKKLARRRREIGGMLAQLPDQFQPHESGGGGGWSFLNACDDKDGNQWTGQHLVMEQLFLLGIGTEQASFCMPRELWNALPGAMPFIEVNPDLKGD